MSFLVLQQIMYLDNKKICFASKNMKLQFFKKTIMLNASKKF